MSFFHPFLWKMLAFLYSLAPAILTFKETLFLSLGNRMGS
jgi:hypothetical protein